MAVAKVWDGSQWVVAIVGAKGDPGDPGIAIDEGSGAADGDILVYDANADVWVPQSRRQAGEVISVYSAIKTDTQVSSTISSGSQFSVSGFSVTATPASANSKFLISGFLTVTSTDEDAINGVYEISAGLIIKRGSSEVGVGDAAGSRSTVHSVGVANATLPNGIVASSIPFHFVDSPATTSSVTYSIDVANLGSYSTQFFVNRSPTDTDSAEWGRTVSSMTVMEIAG